jgi:MFS transporter, PPP family, 3-phenylpropionic acid transporter
LSPTRSPTGTWIAAYYFLLFAGVGVSLPYLPQHFRSLGFSGREIGIVAAITPAMTLLAPPVWGFIADRTRRPDILLRVTGLGVILGNATLALARTFAAALAPMALCGIFGSPQSVLIDSIAVEEVRRTRGVYSRLRLWGSIGFVVASFLFGQFYRGEANEVPRVVLMSLGIAVAYSVVSAFIRSNVATERPRLHDALYLSRRRDLQLLYAVACLHWIACAPYNVFFVVHAKSIGFSPSVAGAALALGVVAEVFVMGVFPALEARISLPRILSLSFAASALRWWMTGSTNSWPTLTAIQTLHGFTFGAFYVASVTYLARAVHPNLRASAQSLLVATAFGVGGVVGYLTSGRAIDEMGGGALFRYAGVFELLPLALSFFLPVPRLGGEARGTLPAQ